MAQASDTARPTSPGEGPGQETAGSILRGTGRALGGALVFSMPMMMTMELWWLGFYIHPLRLALLLIISLPVLTLLSRYVGFERTASWRRDVFDALFAIGVAAVACAVILSVFGVITPGMSAREIFGKIALQTVPASIGALLARSTLGSGSGSPTEDQEESYFGELFLMGLGALFLGLNVAPTEEMVLISFKMTEWHGIVLLLLSIITMHGFVFAVEFKGGTDLSPDTPWWSALIRFTLPGYIVAMLISFYLLWTFGRTDATSFEHLLVTVIVLGFPCSIGAAAARLIL